MLESGWDSLHDVDLYLYAAMKQGWHSPKRHPCSTAARVSNGRIVDGSQG